MVELVDRAVKDGVFVPLEALKAVLNLYLSIHIEMETFFVKSENCRLTLLRWRGHILPPVVFTIDGVWFPTKPDDLPLLLDVLASDEGTVFNLFFGPFDCGKSAANGAQSRPEALDAAGKPLRLSVWARRPAATATCLDFHRGKLLVLYAELRAQGLWSPPQGRKAVDNEEVAAHLAEAIAYARTAHSSAAEIKTWVTLAISPPVRSARDRKSVV